MGKSCGLKKLKKKAKNVHLTFCAVKAAKKKKKKKSRLLVFCYKYEGNRQAIVF